MKTLKKLESLKNADLFLLCGELSAQELRTLKAYNSWVIKLLKVEDQESLNTLKPHPPSKETFLSTLDQLEGALLGAIVRRCPEDSISDSVALPLLNSLEKKENQLLDALSTLRESTKELL